MTDTPDPAAGEFWSYLYPFLTSPRALHEVGAETDTRLADTLISAGYLQITGEEVHITDSGAHWLTTAQEQSQVETTAAAYDWWANTDPENTQRTFETHAAAVSTLHALHYEPQPGHRGFEHGEYSIRDLITLTTMDVLDFLTQHTEVPAAAEHQDDYEDDEDDAGEAEPEVHTWCWCGDPLPEPTIDPDKVCVSCDPATPTYLLGALTPDGTRIDPQRCEEYKRIGDLIEDTYDTVLEPDVPLGDTYIGLPDGTLVDARAWIERPDILAQSTGRSTAPQFDPDHPDRCYVGDTLPSGLIARTSGGRRFDDIAAMARVVCQRVYAPTREWETIEPGTHTVMLPGGTFVDAAHWATLPETRRLGNAPTRNLIRFRAVGTCSGCDSESSVTTTQIVQGEVGQTRRVATAIRCETCEALLPPVFVTVTMRDDTSVADQTPRVIGDLAD